MRSLHIGPHPALYFLSALGTRLSQGRLADCHPRPVSSPPWPPCACPRPPSCEPPSPDCLPPMPTPPAAVPRHSHRSPLLRAPLRSVLLCATPSLQVRRTSQFGWRHVAATPTSVLVPLPSPFCHCDVSLTGRIALARLTVAVAWPSGRCRKVQQGRPLRPARVAPAPWVGGRRGLVRSTDRTIKGRAPRGGDPDKNTRAPKAPIGKEPAAARGRGAANSRRGLGLLKAGTSHRRLTAPS
jgi:hypothetical protein